MDSLRKTSLRFYCLVVFLLKTHFLCEKQFDKRYKNFPIFVIQLFLGINLSTNSIKIYWFLFLLIDLCVTRSQNRNKGMRLSRVERSHPMHTQCTALLVIRWVCAINRRPIHDVIMPVCVCSALTSAQHMPRTIIFWLNSNSTENLKNLTKNCFQLTGEALCLKNQTLLSIHVWVYT